MNKAIIIVGFLSLLTHEGTLSAGYWGRFAQRARSFVQSPLDTRKKVLAGGSLMSSVILAGHACQIKKQPTLAGDIFLYPTGLVTINELPQEERSKAAQGLENCGITVSDDQLLVPVWGTDRDKPTDMPTLTGLQNTAKADYGDELTYKEAKERFGKGSGLCLMYRKKRKLEALFDNFLLRQQGLATLRKEFERANSRWWFTRDAADIAKKKAAFERERDACLQEERRIEGDRKALEAFRLGAAQAPYWRTDAQEARRSGRSDNWALNGHPELPPTCQFPTHLPIDMFKSLKEGDTLQFQVCDRLTQLTVAQSGYRYSPASYGHGLAHPDPAKHFRNFMLELSYRYRDSSETVKVHEVSGGTLVAALSRLGKWRGRAMQRRKDDWACQEKLEYNFEKEKYE